MIMRHELRDGASKVALADRNDPIETFLCNRSHETFGVSIRIGCLIRRLHDTDSRVFEEPSNIVAPLLIAVLTGWLERREREVLAYLIEEHRLRSIHSAEASNTSGSLYQSRKYFGSPTGRSTCGTQRACSSGRRTESREHLSK
jgi:hypothetical protein